MNEPVELWRPVAGNPGYEVSDLGRVRSVPRSYIDALGRNQHRQGCVLKANAVGPEGRPYVQLGRGRHRLVYRLVLEAFVGPAPAGTEACHGDGDPMNNRLDNLRWDTRGANMRDAVRHGTHVKTRRTHCPRGHRLAEPNNVAYARRAGHRECLACSRAQSKGKRLRRQGVEIDRQVVADQYYALIMIAAEGAS